MTSVGTVASNIGPDRNPRTGADGIAVSTGEAAVTNPIDEELADDTGERGLDGNDLVSGGGDSGSNSGDGYSTDSGGDVEVAPSGDESTDSGGDVESRPGGDSAFSAAKRSGGDVEVAPSGGYSTDSGGDVEGSPGQPA
jgi:hypothetical protein